MPDLIVRTNPGTIEGLAPILHSWLDVIQEYPRRALAAKEEDYVCWQTERSQIGFLSIAAWQNGWATLEEWSIQKQGGRGRCDLWIAKETQQFFIEAKIGQCLFDWKKTIETQIDECIEDATKSAKLHLDSIAGEKFAAVFIAPKWRNKEKKLVDQRLLNLWTTALVRKVAPNEIDALAVLVPDFHPKNKDNWLYPGLALILIHVPKEQ